MEVLDCTTGDTLSGLVALFVASARSDDVVEYEPSTLPHHVIPPPNSPQDVDPDIRRALVVAAMAEWSVQHSDTADLDEASCLAKLSYLQVCEATTLTTALTTLQLTPQTAARHYDTEHHGVKPCYTWRAGMQCPGTVSSACSLFIRNEAVPHCWHGCSCCGPGPHNREPAATGARAPLLARNPGSQTSPTSQRRCVYTDAPLLVCVLLAAASAA